MLGLFCDAVMKQEDKQTVFSKREVNHNPLSQTGWMLERLNTTFVPPPSRNFSFLDELAEDGWLNVNISERTLKASPRSLASITPHTVGVGGSSTSPEHNAENYWWDATTEQTNLLSTSRIIKAGLKNNLDGFRNSDSFQTRDYLFSWKCLWCFFSEVSGA